MNAKDTRRRARPGHDGGCAPAALGLSLSVLTSIETRVAANYTNAHEMMAAAETALEFAVRETLSITDWSGIVAGSTTVCVRRRCVRWRSRTLVDGSTVDLIAADQQLSAILRGTCLPMGV